MQEVEEKRKTKTEKVTGGLPQADVLREYEGAGLESVLCFPKLHSQAQLRALVLQLCTGFNVKSGQGQPHPLMLEAVGSASAACNR